MPKGSSLRKKMNVELLDYIDSEAWDKINFFYLGKTID